MPVKVVPAVLARRPADFNKLFIAAARLSDTVHLDLMTRSFVATDSVWPAKLPLTKKRPIIEVHAMTGNFNKLKLLIKNIKVDRIYLPVERGQRLKEFIPWLRKKHIEVGLAINPRTDIKNIKPWLATISSVLILSVIPGRYGAPYLKSTSQRIKAIRRRYPRLTIVCDGGVNERTIKTVIAAGAQRIIVGSAVMLSRTPRLSWGRLNRLTKT